MEPTIDTDVGVVEAVRRGNRHALDGWIRRHGGWVRGVIFGVLGDAHLADDVAQTVWVNVWQRASELREIQSWRSWLYRLARNAAIDAGRRVTRERAQKAWSAEQQVVSAENQDSAHGNGRYTPTELHGEALSAIAGLPALYREPFVLRHLSGWSYKEIGEAMELPVDTVETRLVRARRMLREALLCKEGQGDDTDSRTS